MSPDLILRPPGLEERRNKPWSLQLRYHTSCGETSYLDIARVSDSLAQEIMSAGMPFWLFGEPDWEKRAEKRQKERTRVLRAEADAIEARCCENLKVGDLRRAARALAAAEGGEDA